MNEDKTFKGQLKDEYALSCFRKHWIKILPSLFIIPVLFALLATGATLMTIVRIENTAAAVFLACAFALVNYLMHRQFFIIFNYYLRTVVITNHRIITVDKSIYFRDSVDSIDLSRIQDVHKKQNGIVENILDYGSLEIVLSGSHSVVTIDCIPKPDMCFKKINRVKQSYLPSRNDDVLVGDMANPPLTEEDLVGEMKENFIGGIDETRTRDLLRDRQAL
jgi:hypothetical protein